MKISFKKINVRLGLALAAAMLVAGCSDTATYYKYSQVVVFGAACQIQAMCLRLRAVKTPGPAPYYFGGRWSNGPLWIENVAAEVGKTVTRSSAGGTNFAYGGAKLAYRRCYFCCARYVYASGAFLRCDRRQS